MQNVIDEVQGDIFNFWVIWRIGGG